MSQHTLPELDVQPQIELVEEYRSGVTGIDEMLRLPSDLLNGPLSQKLLSKGAGSLVNRDRTLRRLIRQDGVSYGGALDGKPAKAWQMDLLPIIITAAEWQPLAAGLEQRARLLDALLRDLYGPRSLLRDKVIPAHVIVGHAGFRPIFDGISLPTDHQLLHIATDLVRGPDGEWQVVSDRVQAPSGVAYALANRRLVARVLDVQYRFTPIHRLSGFYDVMRDAMLAAAPPEVDQPRVVVLSPGPASETAFDQALLASLLGFPLVQASDLLMQSGRIYLRTTGRLQQVDVLVRRVDADWSDSLELRGDSRLGVAGLVQAARGGRLSVVNPLGAGVLENPGLTPYLPQIARRILAEDLILPSPQTWWCGEPNGLSHAISHLDELIIKPISRGTASPIAGWLLDENAREEVVAKLRAEPWKWAAQVPTQASTAPVVSADGLQARRVNLRTFAVTHGDDYLIMPGGLARVAAESDDWHISNAEGALAKDVWVLEGTGDDVQPLPVLPRERGVGAAVDARLPDLPPSSADDLYWLGRYAERTEAIARLLIMATQAVEDNHFRQATPGHQAMTAVLEAMSTVTGAELPSFDETHSEYDWLIDVMADPELIGSLRRSAERTAAVLENVRELISVESAGVVAAMLRPLLEDFDPADVDISSTSQAVLQACLAFAGLTAESTVRDPIWAFQEAGRRIERAQLTISLLRATLATVQSPVAESLLATSVLRAGDSLITHDRRVAAGIGLLNPAEAAIELLLFDPTNPRSVQFQLDHFVAALQVAGDEGNLPAARKLAEQLSNVEHLQLYAKSREPLHELLTDLGEQTRRLSDAFAQTHFTLPVQQSFDVSAGQEAWS